MTPVFAASASRSRIIFRRKEQTYRRLQQRVQDLAVSLYKSGPTAEFEVLLSAESIEKLSSLMEYSSAATEDRILTMVKTRWIKGGARRGQLGEF
jgi:hypothetical protein